MSTFICWCASAGTSACEHCSNNPNAKEPIQTSNVTAVKFPVVDEESEEKDGSC